MALSRKDWNLLEMAHRTPFIDNQKVYDMIELAESPEGKDLLHLQWMYLCHKEEEKAGVL